MAFLTVWEAQPAPGEARQTAAHHKDRHQGRQADRRAGAVGGDEVANLLEQWIPRGARSGIDGVMRVSTCQAGSGDPLHPAIRKTGHPALEFEFEELGGDLRMASGRSLKK